MDWYSVDKDYINKLVEIDSKVGFADYGDKCKLHIGVLFNLERCKYYVPISSYKHKHKTMSNSIDFHKIQNEDGYIYAVLNINNMIPVPDHLITQVKYDQITYFREFKDNKEKTDYIYLLQQEKLIIDSVADILQDKAEKLYFKYREFPDSKLSKRCCNFIKLEEFCIKEIPYISK